MRSSRPDSLVPSEGDEDEDEEDDGAEAEEDAEVDAGIAAEEEEGGGGGVGNVFVAFVVVAGDTRCSCTGIDEVRCALFAVGAFVGREDLAGTSGGSGRADVALMLPLPPPPPPPRLGIVELADDVCAAVAVGLTSTLLLPPTLPPVGMRPRGEGW